MPTYSNHCAGVSPYNLWQIDTNETIVMDINTTACAFESTPLYFLTVMGNGYQHSLVGYDVICSATQLGFRIYARSINNAAVSTMYGYSQSFNWNVYWAGHFILWHADSSSRSIRLSCVRYSYPAFMSNCPNDSECSRIEFDGSASRNRHLLIRLSF